VCDITHACVWRESLICVTWLTIWCQTLHHQLASHKYVWLDSCMCVWHDSHLSVTWSTHMCDLTHYMMPAIRPPSLRHVSMCDLTRACVCDMTHIWVWREVLICVTWLTIWCQPLDHQVASRKYVWLDSCMYVCIYMHVCIFIYKCHNTQQKGTAGFVRATDHPSPDNRGEQMILVWIWLMCVVCAMCVVCFYVSYVSYKWYSYSYEYHLENK